MRRPAHDVLHGTLDLLIRRASWGPNHGFGGACWLGRKTWNRYARVVLGAREAAPALPAGTTGNAREVFAFVPRRVPVLVLLVASMVTSMAAAQQRKAGDLHVQPLAFESASRDKVNAELGILTVPETRGDPRSNLIELAFVRFKSTAKKPGAPIVYLAGGPGGSGIDTARGSRFPLFMALREVADVIALDQRGVGMSKPNLGCWDERLNIPLDVVPSREALVAAYRERSRSCADYWKRFQRVDLAAYNTQESADDLEDLRRAIGAKQVSLWGISYGTHLALAAIRRHPRSIDRAILAGVEGPDHTYKLPSSIEHHLRELSAAVRADPTVGDEVPDLVAAMKAVFEKLDREPAVVEITDPLTKRAVEVTVNGFVARRIVANNIGTTVTKAFPSFFYRALRGDVEDAAYAWLNTSRESIVSAMSFMVDCSSVGG